MAQALLVNIDIDRVAEILRILDAAGLKIGIAMWALLGEYNDWRLLIASRRLDAVSQREAYGLVFDALRAADFPIEHEPSFVILPMTDPAVRELRRMFGKAETVEGMRLGGQQIGKRWIESAYVYRVS